MQQSGLPKNIWHIIIGGAIGNLTEWYNILLYGYLASVISQLFFPFHNKLLSLVLTFTVFALSFFARPFGGILFGWIGDSFGRQRALIISLMIMMLATFLIGCLPTYHTIGIVSPILLCFLRICQGLSAGGEHTGSAIYVAEHAPPARRALWVSTVPMSAALGVLISTMISFLIINSFSPEHLLSWGWRVAYWGGALFCLVSLFLRMTLPESPYFKKGHMGNLKPGLPLVAVLKDLKNLKNLLIVFFLASSWGVLYQILYIWMPSYFTHVQHFSNNTALKMNAYFMMLFIALILCFGYCADYINRKLLLMIACGGLLILAYPLFLMLASGVLWQAYVAMGVFTFIFSIFIPTAFVNMVELFESQIRFTGLSFGFNSGLAIFGGTCPLIATWLIEASGNKTAPAFYMMVAAGFALLMSFCIQDKRRQLI